MLFDGRTWQSPMKGAAFTETEKMSKRNMLISTAGDSFFKNSPFRRIDFIVLHVIPVTINTMFPLIINDFSHGWPVFACEVDSEGGAQCECGLRQWAAGKVAGLSYSLAPITKSLHC